MDGLAASRTKNLVHNKQCKAFEKKIFHKYDKILKVFWMPSIMRYSIWTTDKKGNAYMLYVCVDKIDKSYREPNERDLTFIHQMDTYRKEKSYSVLKEIQENNDKLEEGKKKELSDAVMAMSRDRWAQFVGNPVVPVGISF